MRLVPRTLRTRIALLGVTVTGVWVVALTLGFVLVLGAQLDQQADSVLRTRAEAVASTVEVAADGAVSVREGPDDGSDEASDVGTWVFAGTTVVDAASGGRPPAHEVVRLAGTGERKVEIDADHLTAAYALPVPADGPQVATVVTTLSLVPYRRTEDLAVAGSVLLALLFLGIVHLVLRTSTARALRPVEEMTDLAARWSTDDVERRFGDAPRPQELAHLASTLDGVLDQLSVALRHEQSFGAQVSHELRTPLAAVVAEVSLLRSRPRRPEEVDEALARVEEATGRLTAMVDTLMATARQSGTRPGRCRPARVLADLVAQRPDDGPRLRLDVDGDPVAGVDAEVLERIVAPALDNALRHARHEVVLSVARTAEGAQVEVSDDGSGIAQDVAERVFEPGWRADPDDGHDGAGLGMALARRLARAAGGDVAVVAQERGARVRVMLPPG